MKNSHSKEKIDIAILIPKDDEFKAFKSAFELDFKKSDGKLNREKFYYKFALNIGIQESISSISLVVVFLNDQGNLISSRITKHIIDEFDPVLLFLVGTAAGREGKVEIGDVVISSQIVDCQEMRLDEKKTPRIRLYEVPENILVDIKRYLGEFFSIEKYYSSLNVILEKLYDKNNLPKLFLNPQTAFKVGGIASSNYLHLDKTILETFWNIDERMRCIDMESAGFGSVCRNSIQKQWMVIRGVSDYGTLLSKKEEYRVAAAAKASYFLKTFLQYGLRESHPRRIRIPESEDSKLSLDNFYAKYDIISFLKEEIKNNLNIDLSNIELTSSISLTDLESICIGRGKKNKDFHEILSNIREKYFTLKYLNYDYDNDLRGIIPYWSTEVIDIFNRLYIDIRSCIVMDVGIGNGLEVPYLFKQVRKLIGVDISGPMLKKVKEKFPLIRSVHNSAEDLNEIDTNYVDVYISLRTFQSSLFYIAQALREMQRVLKPKGIVILSIANGFVNKIDNEKKIVRGLLIPGSKNLTDKNTPFRIANGILEKLNETGFENTGIMSEKTDIYIWGQKP